jgi:CheY-like chemotaxis protein
MLRPRPSFVKCAMIVDDDKSVRLALRRFLELRGWVVLEAESGEMALELLVADAVQVDAVLVDLGLPGLSGGELCGRIKTLRPALLGRLILVSGDTVAAARALEREQLACPFLSKPFELDDLEQLLDVIVSAA